MTPKGPALEGPQPGQPDRNAPSPEAAPQTAEPKYGELLAKAKVTPEEARITGGVTITKNGKSLSEELLAHYGSSDPNARGKMLSMVAQLSWASQNVAGLDIDHLKTGDQFIFSGNTVEFKRGSETRILQLDSAVQAIQASQAARAEVQAEVTSSAATKPPDFSQEKDKTSDAVDRMLERFEKANLSEASVNRLKKMVEVIVNAKNALDGIDLKSLDRADIGKLSTAWEAGQVQAIADAEGVKDGLQFFLSDSSSIGRRARQMWRTEMVTYLAGKFSAWTDSADNEKRQDFMLATMEAGTMKVVVKEGDSEVVKVKQYTPMEALTSAMHLADGIPEREKRLALAKEMDASDQKGDLDAVREAAGRGNDVLLTICVVTGGDWVEIPVELAGKFTFKNIVWKADQNWIYAQTENGCSGNFVVIEVGAGPPPEPATGAGSGDGVPETGGGTGSGDAASGTGGGTGSGDAASGTGGGEGPGDPDFNIGTP